MAEEALLTRWLRLRAEVKAHKKAIDSHRKDLQRAAAALEACEAECRACGINPIVVAPSGAGVIHGPAVSSHS